MFDRAFDRVDPTSKVTDIAWTWTVMLTAIPAALTFYKTPKAARYINKFYTNCIPMQCTGKQLKIRSKEYIFRYRFSLFDTLFYVHPEYFFFFFLVFHITQNLPRLFGLLF